jgi:multidrug efflux system membrane fusion protein
MVCVFAAGGVDAQPSVAASAPAPVASTSAAASPAAPAVQGVPVTVASAQRQNVPVYLRGLGSVQAYRSVLVRARVDGAIDKIAFTEGQEVQPGELLVQIDPRPYQAALDQAVAKKNADTALLDAANADVDRYTQLSRTEVASKQKLENVRAVANQLQAALQGDDAAIATARLNLEYTRILSPISGRVGLRQVDQGNFVRQAENQTIVTIAQIQPISVVFTLPQDNLARVMDTMGKGKVSVLAFASDDKQLLDEGELLTPDSTIDASTGTIKLKATFPNVARRLWPGQFVNVRLLIETRTDAITVPSAAVQRGLNGPYVYLVQPDSTVARREVTVALDDGRLATVTAGVAEGDRVVTAGHSRLTAGTKVNITAGNTVGTPPQPGG